MSTSGGGPRCDLETLPCCREVCAHAEALLEGRGSGPEWEQLQLHLERCSPCREYIRQLGLTVDALRALAQPAGQDPAGCALRAELVRRFEAWCSRRSGR